MATTTVVDAQGYRPFLERVRRSSRLLDVLVIIALAAGAFSLVAISVSRHQALSPVDEYMYIDYASKVPTEGFVHQGETIGTTARTYASCLGVQIFGAVGDCNHLSVDANYPYGAKTISAVHPPTYFWTVWYGSRVFDALGVHDELDAMRLTSAVYLALGVVGIFILARLLGATRIVGAGIAAIVAAAPSVYWATSFVSNDAPALAISSLVLILATLAWQRRINPWWIVPAGLVAGAFKVQFAGVLGILVVFLVIVLAGARFGFLGLTVDHLKRARRLILPTVAALVAAGGVILAWNIIRVDAAVASDAVVSIATPLTLGGVLLEAVKFLPGALTDTGGVPIGSVVQAVGIAGGWLLVAGLLGSTLARTLRQRSTGLSTVAPSISEGQGSVRAAALAVLISFVVLGPALVVVLELGSHAYYILPPRYGLVLIPALAALGAAYWSRSGRVAQILILALGLFEVVSLAY
jgi:hypothetical protein